MRLLFSLVIIGLVSSNLSGCSKEDKSTNNKGKGKASRVNDGTPAKPQATKEQIEQMKGMQGLVEKLSEQAELDPKTDIPLLLELAAIDDEILTQYIIDGCKSECISQQVLNFVPGLEKDLGGFLVPAASAQVCQLKMLALKHKPPSQKQNHLENA